MALQFTAEQAEFRSILRRYFQDRFPIQEIRRTMVTETGWDRTGWQKMNKELGLSALFIPKEFGGQGFGFVELCITCEEMGRALLCTPYFASSVMATITILNSASKAQKLKLLPSIATGETIFTLAIAEDNGLWNANGIDTVATNTNGRIRIDGHKSFVVDGCSAEQIVVVARRPKTSGQEGLGFYLISGDDPGLKRRPLVTLDETRKLARLCFNNASASPLNEAKHLASDAFETSLSQMTVCLSNEMVGGAEKLRESALEYAMLRTQFGRTIASFQAIKHSAADILLEVEMAKSAAYYAATAADNSKDDLQATSSLAKACCSDTYMKSAIHAIQTLGGIGFTWENDTHLWFKRAKSSEVLLGDASWHREKMLENWHTMRTENIQ